MYGEHKGVAPDSLVDSLREHVLEDEEYEGGIDLCEYDRLLYSVDTLLIRMWDHDITDKDIDKEMGWDGRMKELLTSGRPNPAYLVLAGIAVGKLIERSG